MGRCMFCKHHECENEGIAICKKKYIPRNDCVEFQKIENVDDVLDQVKADIKNIIKDYKMEVNGSFEHKLSDVLIAKDSLNDLLDIYFEEMKKELDD